MIVFEFTLKCTDPDSKKEINHEIVDGIVQSFKDS